MNNIKLGDTVGFKAHKGKGFVAMEKDVFDSFRNREERVYLICFSVNNKLDTNKHHFYSSYYLKKSNSLLVEKFLH
tara:strand:+ start:3620 stop:3847 length:228 start_codon:yes stop_codon:yes gene_type:complete